MSSYVIKEFLGFLCLAEACEDTCCAGWSIDVPREDYLRFQKIAPDSLKEEIFRNLSHKGDTYSFQNRDDGRCSMLLDNGLCRIQKETSEKELCYTCRKYPRLFFSFPGEKDSVCVSMAASCPVIAQTLVTGEITIVRITDGRAQPFREWKQEQPWDALWYKYEADEAVAKEYLLQKSNVQGLYDTIRFLTSEIFSMFAHNNEDCVSRLLEGLFPLVQCDDASCFEAFTRFLSRSKDLWLRVKTNYIAYRFFSKGAEGFLDVSEVLTGVQGELLLLRALAFSQMLQKETDQRMEIEDWEKSIRIMYRNCAHGKYTVQKLTSIFQQMFQQEILWNIILQ